MQLDRLVPYDGTDFLVRPYSGQGPLLPGDPYRHPHTDIRWKFEAITGDPERRGFSRVKVTDLATDATHTAHPAEVGLTILAVVDARHDSQRPHGGDAIRLAAPWAWASEVKVGELGVLDGHIDRESEGGSVCMRASTHRDRRSGWVSCSGGPATIHTDATQFLPTAESSVLPVWDWGKNSRGAGNNVAYLVRVRVWDWFPTD